MEIEPTNHEIYVQSRSTRCAFFAHSLRISGRLAARKLESSLQRDTYALRTSSNAHSSQGRSFSISDFSTVAPHQKRNPAGASL